MSQALHYPSIEFNDVDALKRALLVWDRVYRIVPAGYQPNDQTEIQTAIQSDAVVNLSVDAQEKTLAAQRFLDFHYLRNSTKTRLIWPAGFSTET
ncbi:hypothetical protein, partial [Methylicorpusculum sp.]